MLLVCVHSPKRQRASGTLDLLLAIPVSEGQIVRAHLLGGACIVLPALFTFDLLFLLSESWTKSSFTWPDALLRLVLHASGILAWLAFYSVIALGASLRERSVAEASATVFRHAFFTCGPMLVSVLALGLPSTAIGRGLTLFLACTAAVLCLCFFRIGLRE